MRKKTRKAPRNCFWKDDTLYGRKKIKGRDFKWSLHTSDGETARGRVKEDIERLISRVRFGDTWTTWEDAVAGWTENFIPDRDIGAATAARYAVSLRQLEPYLLGRFVDGKADAANGGIDATTIADIVAGRRKDEVTTATIRRDLGAAGSVLTWCQQEGLRSDNPALDRLRLLVEKRDPIVLPAAADIERVIARLPGMLAALTRAALATGCRQAELVNARRTNLNHERKELTVIGKGNKLRVIDLAPFGGYDIFRSLPAYVGSPYLFWHGKGEPYRNLSSRFAAVVRDFAGKNPQNFHPFRFHDLRHLHAVEWLRDGRSIYDLQQRLGHSSILTTELYLKFLTPDQVRTAKQARSA